MAVSLEDILKTCKKNEEEIIDNIIHSDVNDRRKKYIQKGKHEIIRREECLYKKIKYFFSSKFPDLEQWFEWTQCQDPKYNKFYTNLIRDVKENIDSYRQVLDFLYDEKSKRCLLDIIKWRLTLRSDFLVDAYSLSDNKQYFESFLGLNDKEIFVDCGGYIGDSTLELINFRGGVKKVYLYEADSRNILEARKNLKNYDVVYRSVGVGDCNKKLIFSQNGNSTSSFSTLNENNCISQVEMEIVSIDDDISANEHVSFIKMDIEGMELPALQGAKNHINVDRPVLAICLYHNLEDAWKLPLYVKEIVGKNYRFYMRHYTYYHGETVFYAVPTERLV